jgi:predicted nucleic acid-binding Zn ribbon protein
MPVHEYVCAKQHLHEVFFPTFGSVTETSKCPECGAVGKKILSMPGAPVFYGDGWTTPAPSGRTHTKMGDPSKAAKEVMQEMGTPAITQSVARKTKRR